MKLEEVTTNKLLGFLVDFNIRTVTYKLTQPRPPVFPPPVGRSPPGVSNAEFPFLIVGEIQVNSPLYRFLFCHILQAVKVIWQQIGGAGIGSHISPSLSNFAVTIAERSWTQVFKEVLDLQLFRFLPSDTSTNGICYFPRRRSKKPTLQVLFCKDFYQHPVKLEPVTSNELLGFLVDFNIRTVTYELPQPRPLGFPPPVGRSPPGVSNTALPFSMAPNKISPLYRRLCFRIFPVVNVICMNCRVFC